MKEKHFCRGLFQAYKQLYACWRKHLAGLLSLSPLAECAAVTRQREMQSRAVEDICSKLCRIRSMCMLSQKKARRPVPGERKAFQRKRGGGRLSTAPEFLSSLSHFLLSVFQELNLKVKYSVFLRSLVDEKSVRVYRSVHEEVLIKKKIVEYLCSAMHVNFSFLSRKPSTVYAELEDLDGVSYCIPCRRQISTKMTMWHSMSSVHKTEVAVYIRPSRNQASFILQRYQMCISQCRNEISMLLAQRETGTERVYKKAEPYPRRSASALPSKEKPPKKKQSMHVPECHICNQVFAEHRSFFEHFTQQPHIRKLKPHLPSVSKASAKEFTGITTIQGIQNRLSFG